MLANLALDGEIKRGNDEIKKAVFITDVSFKWNPISLSYISTGKIGIGHIFKKEVFKYVTGKIEIKKDRKYDVINMILQIDETKFFYFSYSTKTGVADAYFSDAALNTTIQEMKADKLKTKGKPGEKDFEYRAGSSSKANAFRLTE